MLRRENRIRTIQASLATEHNTLSVEQVTAVIEGRTVLGLPREIQEVRNAFAAYEAMPDWDPASAEDLLGAHGLLMRGLCDDAGHWRRYLSRRAVSAYGTPCEPGPSSDGTAIDLAG